MPLTPQDQEIIAALIKAGSCGYLPPYLLQQQLVFNSYVADCSFSGNVIANANANRVYLAILDPNSHTFLPALATRDTTEGWASGSAPGQHLWWSTFRDGILPQLEWVVIAGGGGNVVVVEQVWQPATGLGIV